MKAFLSYQFKDNIEGILSLLRDNNIEVLDSLTDIPPSSSFQLAIMTAIKESDFLLLLCTSPNTNIAFEAGIAIAFNKPIFSILSPLIQYEDYLQDSTLVRAFPEEVEKISFSLNLFLKNIHQDRILVNQKQIKFYGGEGAGPSDYYYNRFIHLKNSQSLESDFETLLKEMFELNGFEVVPNITTPSSRPDFSLWSDQLSNIFGNPIIVEVKKVLNNSNLPKVQEQVTKILSQSPTSSFLVFYDELTGIRKNKLPQNPKCFYIQIADLISNLRVVGFNEALTTIRNQIVHNSY